MGLCPHYTTVSKVINENGEIDFILSRQDLASVAGTTYETVFRIMNEFVQQDTIKVYDKNISIIDQDKLSLYTRDANP